MRRRDRVIQAAAIGWSRSLGRPLARLFHQDLIVRTSNFTTTSWLGVPIWQNVFDLWTTHETIAEVRPALLIETATHHGGSAQDARPGPLEANRSFLRRHPEFEHDRERNERFGLTHHPLGWMRRRY
jgi:cephalosporin hydroxylase